VIDPGSTRYQTMYNKGTVCLPNLLADFDFSGIMLAGDIPSHGTR
jgi:hypothetical protein